MSLGRLLTSGKSLVGLQNDECRYEMRPKNLLPKFGSDKNPFLTKAGPEPVRREAVSKLPTVPRTLKPVDSEVEKPAEAKPLPAIKSIKTEASAGAKPTVNLKMLKRVNGWLKKLNPLNWRSARRETAAKSAGTIAKALVQTELSLDKIKVLRNDLTEADLEVVPVKISVASKQQPATPPAKVAETAELIKT